ncbi:TetR family transcriptional regulator [Heyndrickxia acidicola]|uniref:TetR family transcriptional regulator n=1 Tax=Heyndrickxia acidicola TaxID=209389 RepID=A0ABU6MI41_9BACI|nr:TetR family transcriptional regulator [Heyndrickxia acidicola]MED1204340.1 TetR family transcriptional regulator [Heyndrickxia acidicola]
MAPKISEEEKGRRRSHIVQSAKNVFIRKGYEASSMQDIVDETKMSRGWVYLYFANKEEIMKAILIENEMETEQMVENLLASRHSVWEGLKAMLTAIEQELLEGSDNLDMVFYEYFLGGLRNKERHLFLEGRYDRQHRFIMDFLQQGVLNNEFSPLAEIEVIVKMITSYFEGIMLHTRAAGPDQVRVREQMELFKTVLKNILQVQDSKGEY